MVGAGRYWGIYGVGAFAGLETAIDPVPARLHAARRNPDWNRGWALAPEHPLDTIDDSIENGAVVEALVNHGLSPSAVGDGAFHASPCVTITRLEPLWFHNCVISVESRGRGPCSKYWIPGQVRSYQGMRKMETTDIDGSGSTLQTMEGSAKRRTMTRQGFFAEVVVGLRANVPEAFRDFNHRSNPLLLKIDYGNPRVHYEVWCDAEKAILGVGLHFEDGPLSTDAYLAFFDRHILEIKHILGTDVELERWTASWGHLYEHRVLRPLTDEIAAEVALLLAQMIAVLQPLLESAGIPPERSAEGSERKGAWRKWRR